MLISAPHTVLYGTERSATSPSTQRRVLLPSMFPAAPITQNQYFKNILHTRSANCKGPNISRQLVSLYARHIVDELNSIVLALSGLSCSATTTSRRPPLVLPSPNSDTVDLSCLRSFHHNFGVGARRAGTNAVISPGLGVGSGPAEASALPHSPEHHGTLRGSR